MLSPDLKSARSNRKAVQALLVTIAETPLETHGEIRLHSLFQVWWKEDTRQWAGAHALMMTVKHTRKIGLEPDTSLKTPNSASKANEPKERRIQISGLHLVTRTPPLPSLISRIFQSTPCQFGYRKASSIPLQWPRRPLNPSIVNRFLALVKKKGHNRLSVSYTQR